MKIELSSKSTECPNCARSLSKSRKIWANLKPDGQSTNYVVKGTTILARRVEAKINSDIAQKKKFNLEPALIVDTICAT